MSRLSSRRVAIESSMVRIELVENAMRGRTRQQRLHRRKQHRLGDFGAGAEGIDPADLAEQPDDLQEGQQDADDQNAEDQPVEAGIGGEGRRDLAGQDGGDEGDDARNTSIDRRKTCGLDSLYGS